MATWLDNIVNPLVEQLSVEMGGTADIDTLSEWISRAAGEAENLWRVSADTGIGAATNAVALYTGVTDGVYLGNLAADASLRNPDIVALDTTNLGRLIINLSRAGATMMRTAKDGTQ